MVLVAITPMRRSDPASVEPGLKPNHPKHRMKVPTRAIGMLWPGIALADPSGLYLPRRGPRRAAPTSAIIPPVICTTDRSEEHTSELQSQSNLVCRLLLEKRKNGHPFPRDAAHMCIPALLSHHR